MDDNKRVILAAVLSFALLIFYFQVIYPILAPKPVEPAPAESVATKPAVATPVKEPVREQVVAQPVSEPAMRAAQEVKPTVVKAAEDYVVETPLFLTTFTNRGAAIKEIRLRDFNTYPKNGQPLELISELEPGKFSLVMSEVRGLGELDSALWQHVSNAPVPDGFSHVEQFRITIPEKQLEITKTFLFTSPPIDKDQRYVVAGRDIVLRIVVKNLSGGEKSFQYRLVSAAGIMPDPQVPPLADPKLGPTKDIAAVVGSTRSDGNAKIDTFAAGKDPRRVQGGLYAGVRNRYFTAVLRPREKADLVAVNIEKIGAANVAAVLELGTLQLGAGESAQREFTFLVSPRVPDVLKHYDGGQFEPLVEYGWPRPVTRALMWFLQAIYKVVPNYGVAIVILTIIVRSLLHPLTLRSQKTSHKMQQIQPLLSAAKEKYKHDKRVQQQEVMKIMKESGANPLGGCLPMLLQMPIFIALWSALYQDVTLRHAPFMLWINDLSAPDNIVTLGFSLPLLGQCVNMLPILCAIAMFFQQKMMPMNPDPKMAQQQKIMMFMPIIFTFMLYSMPSGLMLYFLASTVFGLLEQKHIFRRLNKALASAPSMSIPVDKKQKR